MPPGRRETAGLGAAERLRLFDRAAERQLRRDKRFELSRAKPEGRGWQREELYDRGEPG